MAICQELWFAEHRSEMGYKAAATGRRPRALEGELTCKIFACPWIFPEFRINQKNTGTLESFFRGRRRGLAQAASEPPAATAPAGALERAIDALLVALFLVFVGATLALKSPPGVDPCPTPPSAHILSNSCAQRECEREFGERWVERGRGREGVRCGE